MINNKSNSNLYNQIIINCDNLEFMVNYLDTQINLDLINFGNLIDPQNYSPKIVKKDLDNYKQIIHCSNSSILCKTCCSAENRDLQESSIHSIIKNYSESDNNHISHQNFQFRENETTQEESINIIDIESIITIDSQQRVKEKVRKNYKKLLPNAQNKIYVSDPNENNKKNCFKKINWWVKLKIKFRNYQLIKHRRHLNACN